MIAHNLSREIKMLATPLVYQTQSKRPAAWAFQRLDTIRHRIFQRAGLLAKPARELTLTMSANQSLRKDLLRFLDTLQMAA
jgi:hypothetical protein